MLRFIVRAGHRVALEPYLQEWAGSFASRVELVSYDELFRSRSLPLVTHVFTDLERLDPAERENAACLWSTLERSGQSLRLLNHPLAAMRGYELLRDPQQCSSLASRPVCDDAAEPWPEGVHKKYGVLYVGGAVIPRHILCSAQWLVQGKTSFVDERVVEEERRFIEENPHEREVREILQRARIDYGRIDYGVVGGRIEVYEINTNPPLVSAGPWPRTEKKERFAAALTEAFRRLEESTPQAEGEIGWVHLDPPLEECTGDSQAACEPSLSAGSSGPAV
jgi:hypothetical protein